MIWYTNYEKINLNKTIISFVNSVLNSHQNSLSLADKTKKKQYLIKLNKDKGLLMYKTIEIRKGMQELNIKFNNNPRYKMYYT